MFQRTLYHNGFTVEVAGSATYGDTVAVITDRNGMKVVLFMEAAPRGPESPYTEFVLDRVSGTNVVQVRHADSTADSMVALFGQEVDSFLHMLEEEIDHLTRKSEERKRYNALFGDFVSEVYTLEPLIYWYKSLRDEIMNLADRVEVQDLAS